MAKFKIIVIGLLVASNQVKKFGDIVDESELTRPASDLIAEGFIEEVEEVETENNEVEEVETEDPVVEEVETETTEVLEVETETTEVEASPLDKIKKNNKK